MTKNVLQPNTDQVRAFRDRATGEPIQMLNLLKFKEVAAYQDDDKQSLSGQDAYYLYVAGFRRVMEPKGSKVLFSGDARGFLIGEGEGEWDAVMLIEYPSTQVMLDMFRDEEYQKVQIHREAALEGQLLIECGSGFRI